MCDVCVACVVCSDNSVIVFSIHLLVCGITNLVMAILGRALEPRNYPGGSLICAIGAIYALNHILNLDPTEAAKFKDHVALWTISLVNVHQVHNPFLQIQCATSNLVLFCRDIIPSTVH
jgi:hypothetical protein